MNLLRSSSTSLCNAERSAITSFSLDESSSAVVGGGNVIESPELALWRSSLARRYSPLGRDGVRLLWLEPLLLGGGTGGGAIEGGLGFVATREGRLKDEVDGVLFGGTGGRAFKAVKKVSSMGEGASGAVVAEIAELVLEVDMPRFRPCRRGGGRGGSFELDGEEGTGGDSIALGFTSEIEFHCSGLFERGFGLS